MIDPTILQQFTQLKDFFRSGIDHYAGVTEAARNKFDYPQRGTSDIYGHIEHRHISYPNRVQIKPNVDLPQYSISTIYGLYADTDPATGPNSSNPVTVFKTEAVNVNPSLSSTASYYGFGYVVNQENAISSGNYGWATLLVPGVPTLVVADSTTPPKIGSICGIAPGAFKAIGSNYRDLFCLSVQSANNVADVVWVPWMQLQGKPTSNIAAATDPFTGAVAGTMTPYVKDTTSAANPIKYIASSITTLAVVNRTGSAPATTNMIRVLFIEGEWQIVWADC